MFVVSKYAFTKINIIFVKLIKNAYGQFDFMVTLVSTTIKIFEVSNVRAEIVLRYWYWVPGFPSIP